MFSSNTSQVAAGGGAVFVEDIFSTYLYTGNGSTQTITNGIDLAGEGGLVWIKARNSANDHSLEDTLRTVSIYAATLSSNTTAAQSAGDITGFTSSGFSLRDYTGATNSSGTTYASWTFREQAKFFDVVTWSGNSTARTIAHNLGSAPGCIIVKAYSGTDAATANWAVYHQSLGNGFWLKLESTSAALSSGNLLWTTTAPTATEFSLGGGGVTEVNKTGHNYIAYVFAHDAGGFGLTGTDNVISCGSFTTDGSGNATVSLGYEPQFLIHKATTGSESWLMLDTMRGWNMSTADRDLFCNSASAEASGNYGDPTSTGFTAAGLSATRTYIYIAIRRGPMKVPTSGTSVFDISTVSTSSGPVPGPTPTDMTLNKPSYNVSSNDWRAVDRLRGGGLSLFPNTTGAESAENYVYFDYQSGLRLDSWPIASTIWYNFKRAPSFFDEVCYTGTGTNQFLNHNLGVRPDLYIVKRRNFAANWVVTVNASIPDTVGILNSTNAFGGSAYNNGYLVNGTVPASNFGAGFGSVDNDAANRAGNSYVAYLFATCAGVSKVGSYTGNGSTQTIDCGFTGGARFVLIKRTDATGDWYVYDTARGMTTLTDPYLFLNSTAAETATLGSVTTVSTGFALNSSVLAAINVSGGSYIFFAVA